jgi:uncharacterized membrane-anchored protein
VVAAMLAVVLGSIAWNEWELASGTQVRLRVQPVDPHDPFRGEYVDLSYPISNIRIVGPPGPKTGATVYVPLRRFNGVWTGGVGMTNRPSNGETFIRGRVTSANMDSHSVKYGIETFYVEEGQAQKYERAIVDGSLYADVVIDGSGEARLKDLVIRPQ